MTNPARWSARTEVASLIGFGLLLGLIGGLLVYLALSEADRGGSQVLLILGSLFAAFGQVLVAVGVIAIGVRLGTRE